jgi:1-acyl-sn-glycerol-3-phosphate acyltransferase
MKFLLAPIRILYCLYAFVVFMALMIIVIPIVFISLFFGKIKGGNFIFRVCSYWADVWFFLIGIYHRNIYETPHKKSQQYIFVANHIAYIDAPIIVKTIRQPVRVLGKIEMAGIPLFGFIYRNAIVTVDRSNAVKRANSVRILKSVLKRKISIFMFPEGTFNETKHPLKEFYDGAFRIAIETQTPVKPVLFLDSYDRMHYKSILSLTPGISRSVFLEEISVDGLTLKDVQMLKQKTYSIMEDALMRYDASWIGKNLKVKISIRK